MNSSPFMLFERNADLVTRKIAGETLVVPVRRQVGDLEALFTLNEVGTWIWHRLDGRTTVAQLAEELSGEFQVPREDAERDAQSYLAHLEEAGLVHRVAGGSGDDAPDGAQEEV